MLSVRYHNSKSYGFPELEILRTIYCNSAECDTPLLNVDLNGRPIYMFLIVSFQRLTVNRQTSMIVNLLNP